MNFDKLIDNLPGVFRYTLIGLLHLLAILLVLLACLSNGLAYLILPPRWARWYYWWTQRQMDYPIAAPWDDPWRHS